MPRWKVQLRGKGISRPTIKRLEISKIANYAADRLAADDAIKFIDRGVATVMNKWEFDHPIGDLQACEAAAKRVQMCSRTAGTITGAVTGVGGLAAIPADIAASLMIMSGTTHATALAFGYSDNLPVDQLIRLHAINLALSSSKSQHQIRVAAIDELLQRANIRQDSETMMAFQQLALGLLPGMIDNLISWILGRIGGKAVPVVSAVTGGYIGYRLQTLAAESAIYIYRERWKLDQLKLIGTQVSDPGAKIGLAGLPKVRAVDPTKRYEASTTGKSDLRVSRFHLIQS